MQKKMHSIRNFVSSVYSKKLNKSLNDGNSKPKKLRNIRNSFQRPFKSVKQKKIMKIVLLASVVVGVGVVIGYHPFLRKTVIAFNSKIHGFFDRNENSKAALKAAKEPKSNLEKFILTGITVLILGVGKHFLSYSDNETVDVIEVPIVVFFTRNCKSFIKKWHVFIGGFTVIGAIPAWLNGIISPSIYNALWWGGYIVATWVFEE